MKPPQQQAKQVDIDALAASIHVLRVRFDKSEEKSKQTEKKLNTLLADFRTACLCHAKYNFGYHANFSMNLTPDEVEEEKAPRKKRKISQRSK